METSNTAVLNEAAPAELGVYRQCVRLSHYSIKANLDGITHEESLIQPQVEGNCINWVLGHLVYVYNNVLMMVGEKQAVPREWLERYNRGTAPLKNRVEALELSELTRILDEIVPKLEAGLGRLSAQDLDAPAPISPTNDPNETVRSLLGIVAFHQAYHVGQLGILRRLMGKKGAIA